MKDKKLKTKSVIKRGPRACECSRCKSITTYRNKVSGFGKCWNCHTRIYKINDLI